MALPTAPQRDSAAHGSVLPNSADFEKDRDLLRAILSSAVTHGASDIHIRAEAQPVLRVSGDLWPLEMDPLTPEQAESMVLAAMDSEREREEFLTEHECDFALADPGVGRFRVNAYRARGGAAMVLRHVKEDIPSIEDLGLPPVVKDLALRPSGLILVSGPTGSGKTTSLAAMIDVINSERRCHILTIEDPIEFMHNGKLATVSQREVNTDTLDFERALRSGMRQDPDVIFVGEIRDALTMRIALQAAETGHLVLATLHARTAADVVHRSLDLFPAEEQAQARTAIAESLEGVMSQRLVRSADGQGRRLVLEIGVGTTRLKDAIAHPAKTGDLEDIIADGEYYGMRTFQQEAVRLVLAGEITVREAELVVPRVSDLHLALRKAGFRAATEGVA